MVRDLRHCVWLRATLFHETAHNGPRFRLQFREMDPRTAFDSPRREEIIANCATSRVCRRCAGNTMILDTQPIRGDWQAVDKFGFGWHPFESYLFGIGGRWTSGSAQSYFYTRIESVVLSMEFRSPFPSATKFQMLL